MFRLEKFTVSLSSVSFTFLQVFFYAFSQVKVKKKKNRKKRENLLIYIERGNV